MSYLIGLCFMLLGFVRHVLFPCCLSNFVVPLQPLPLVVPGYTAEKWRQAGKIGG